MTIIKIWCCAPQNSRIHTLSILVRVVDLQGHTDNGRSELAPRFSWLVLSLVTTTTVVITTTVIVATTDQTVWQTLCPWFSHWILLESVPLFSSCYTRGHWSLSQPEIDRTAPSQFSLSLCPSYLRTSLSSPHYPWNFKQLSAAFAGDFPAHSYSEQRFGLATSM